MKFQLYTKVLLTFILLSLFWISPNLSQAAPAASSNYKITRDVTPGGGGAGTSGNYSVSTASGQSSAIGVSDSTNYQASGGFYIPANNTTELIGFWPWNVAALSSFHVFGRDFEMVAPLNITIDSVPAYGYFVIEPTHMVVIAPFGTLDGKIVISGPNGAVSSTNNYGPIPTVLAENGFWPVSASPLQTIHVFGADFVDGVMSISFNGTPAVGHFIVDSTHMVVIVPSGATDGPISLTSPSGTVTTVADFIFIP